MAIVNGQNVPNVNSMAQWGQTPVVNPSQISSTGVGADALNNPMVQQNLGYTQGITNQPQTNTAGNDWFSQSALFGGTDAAGNKSTGWAAPALGAIGGLAQSWLGFQNLGLAQDQLAFQQNAWQDQFNLQKEEFDYQKQRRQERVDNYNASRNTASSPTQRVVGATM